MSKTIIVKSGGEDTRPRRRAERTQQQEITAEPDARLPASGFLGVSPVETYRPVGFFDAFPETFSTMGKVVTGTGQAFAARPRRLHGSEQGGHARTDDRSGRASSRSSGRAASSASSTSGARSPATSGGLLALLGIVSFSLGLINLLPLLPFDGGHAAVVVYEWIASKIRAPASAGRLPQAHAGHHGVHGAVPRFALSTILLDVDAIGGS